MKRYLRGFTTESKQLLSPAANVFDLAFGFEQTNQNCKKSTLEAAFRAPAFSFQDSPRKPNRQIFKEYCEAQPKKQIKPTISAHFLTLTPSAL
jgi:hypothetical protein